MNFEPSQIIQGPTVSIRKCSYTAFASTIYSVEQAISILDYVGKVTDSDSCLPFAISLVEGGEYISIAEDNGEFGCGDLLARCLDKLKEFNVLVCVSRRLRDSFNPDIIQEKKFLRIKEAANGVIDKIYDILTSKSTRRDSPPVPCTSVSSLVHLSSAITYEKPSLLPKRIQFDSDSIFSMKTNHNKQKKPGRLLKGRLG